jgi:hypothetical protein
LIVVKPNWVQEGHEYEREVWESVITSPDLVLSVVECVAERVAGGRATICICDAPHSYASFSAILSRGQFGAGFASLAAKYPSVKFQLLDLRREVSIVKEQVVVERRSQPDDPRGYVQFDLGEDSLFYGHHGEGHFYGADYDSRVVNCHHHGKVQEYLVSGTATVCDLFINLAKMKTHQKTGITCCLKNLVGINGEKNWLPHHTEGWPESHGDEFPRRSSANWLESAFKGLGRRLLIERPSFGTRVYRQARKCGELLLGQSSAVIRNGNWSGNDTCWRMALDLNRALLYGNLDGTLRDGVRPKACLSIVDGIVGGQGDGPLCPDPVQSNVLVSGTNPAEVDAVVATLMGFDPAMIPLIKQAFEPHRWPIMTKEMDTLNIFDERIGRAVALKEVAPAVPGGFAPHFGWTGIIDKRVLDGVSG